MFKCKKNNLFFMVGIILFTLFLFSSMMTSGILARYSGNDENNDDAKVARFYANESNSEEELSLNLSPGSSVTFTIEIVNHKDDIVCETTLNYGFTIETLENLPLKVTISNATKVGNGILATINGLICSNGVMNAASKDTHTFVVTVSWDTTIDGWNDYENSKKVDLVIVNFNATQVD